MAKLMYSTIASLDGYVEDQKGNFDWAEPDEEVHTFINDLERSVGTYLYGRRIYEVMVAWEDSDGLAEEPAYMQDFASIWQGAEKVVYSKSLETVTTARTRLERTFEPEAVREFKSRSDRNLSVGGPDLAGEAIRAGLVDEYHLFLAPVVVGGGKRWLPEGLRIPLELLDERRFGSGTVYLRYAAQT